MSTDNTANGLRRRAWRARSLQGALLRYGAAIVIVAAAGGVRLAFLPTLGTRVAFITFYPAVMLVALYGGLGPGLLATVLSAALADYFWMEPVGAFNTRHPVDWLSLGIFLMSGAMISLMAQTMRRAQRRAVNAEFNTRIAADRARAAETVRQSEERFKALATATFEGIVISAEGRYTDTNDQFLEMLGYSREELLGTDIAATLLAEDRDRVLKEIREGRESHIEHRMVRKDGALIAVEAHGKTIEYQGREVRFTAIRDVTERKQAEEALREKERLLSESQRIAHIGGWSWDLEGGTQWTEETYRIYGVSPQTFTPTVDALIKLLHPDDRPAMLEWIRACRAGEKPAELEIRTILPDSTCRVLLGRGELVCDAENRAIRMAGTVQDITARKEADESLRRRVMEIETIYTSASVGLALLDTELRYVRVNPSLAEMNGAPVQAHIGRTVREIVPDLAEQAQGVLRQIIETGQPQRDVEFVGMTAAQPGVRRTWIEQWVPLRDAAGRIIGITASAAEVTRERTVQEQLRVAKEAAEGASKAKGDFLAVLSHELRTPLAPVLATSTMLRDDPRFDADTREQLDIICRNTEMEARLIDDLLDVTRIERGKVELERRPIDLCVAIRRAAEVCRADIEARQLEFVMDLEGDPCWVDADITRMQQVFWNLLRNAIKFTPHGGHVGIRCWREGDGFVVAEIKDNGVGMEPAALGCIFNAFEQAGRSVTRQFGGLGLGLAISKAIVELHGGTIQAESAGKGQGSALTVRLPLLPTPAAAAAISPGTSWPAPTPPLRSLRILLVEDHIDTARTMRRLLSADGHEAQVAADVATALKLGKEWQFDLLLSDLGLPDGSGLDLLRSLRAAGINLPAIALSGFGQDKDVQACREVGFASHLVKPVNLHVLQETIQQVAAGPHGH